MCVYGYKNQYLLPSYFKLEPSISKAELCNDVDLGKGNSETSYLDKRGK